MYPTNTAAPLGQCNGSNHNWPPKRRSLLRRDAQGVALVRLASGKCREERGDILNRKLMFALNCDHVRHPVDAKRPQLFAECAIAADIEAIPVPSALPAKHRSTRHFVITRDIVKVDQQPLDAVRIALTDMKFYLPVRMFVIGPDWTSLSQTPGSLWVRHRPACRMPSLGPCSHVPPARHGRVESRLTLYPIPTFSPRL